MRVTVSVSIGAIVRISVGIICSAPGHHSDACLYLQPGRVGVKAAYNGCHSFLPRSFHEHEHPPGFQQLVGRAHVVGGRPPGRHAATDFLLIVRASHKSVQWKIRRRSLWRQDTHRDGCGDGWGPSMTTGCVWYVLALQQQKNLHTVTRSKVLCSFRLSLAHVRKSARKTSTRGSLCGPMFHCKPRWQSPKETS